MQTRSRILDDLAKVANGAASTLVGIKDEIEAVVHQRIESYLASMDMVTRDEFDAVRAMAAKARTEQERLEKRVAELEAKLAAKPARAASAKKPSRAAPKSPQKDAGE